MIENGDIQNLIDAYGESIWAVDTNLRLIYFNAYFKEDFKNAFGIDLTRGMDLLAHASREVSDFWLPRYQAALSGKRVSFTFKENSLRGNKYFRVNLNPLEENGTLKGVSAISVDITGEETARRLYEAEQRKAQQYLEIAGVMFVAIDTDGLITMVNRKLCEVTGYTKEELIGSNWFSMMLPEREREEVAAVAEKLLRGEIEPVEYYENTILTKEGFERIVAWHNTLVTNEEGVIEGHLSSGTDVTEQRILEARLKEREEFFKTVADYTAGWEYWMSPDGSYLYISPAVESITGYTPEDFHRIPGLIDKIIHPADKELFKHHKKTVSPMHDPVDFRIITKNNTVKWIGHVCRPIYDSRGNYRGIRASNRDITKRKCAEKEISNLLREKEYLLKEVHHRIKNNMATLVSLINLQLETVKGEEAKSALLEIENRIRSMLTLYSTLFESGDFEHVSLKQYLGTLVDSIVGTFPEAEKITVYKKLDNLNLPVKVIFSIGIIINELVTNAMKYAFKDNPAGHLKVGAVLTGNSIQVSVEDSGNGIPDGVDIFQSEGFGLKLIRLLTKQLQGRLELDGKEGTKITITIPLEKKK